MTNAHEQLDTITVKTTAKSDGTAYAFVYDNDELVYAVKDTATKFEESISSRARKGYIVLKFAYDYACEQNKQEHINELGWHLIEAQEKAQELYNELHPQQETIEVTITLDGHDPVTMSEPDAIEYFNVVFNTNNTPQWIFETEIIHDELRVYASRNFDYKNDDDDYSLQPDTYNWVMIDDDNGYLVIGDVIEISSQ